MGKMKRTALRKVSKKRAKQNREYSKVRKRFLVEAPFCEAECFATPSNEIHHIHHREGIRLLDRKQFLAVCRNCHRKIHDNPKWAREKGIPEMNTYGPLFDNNLSGRETVDSTRQLAVKPCAVSVTEAGNQSEPTPYSDNLPAQNLRVSRCDDATTGQQLKEKGIKEVSEHNKNWMERALSVMDDYIAWKYHASEFTGEDIRFLCGNIVGLPTHPNAWGALINTLIKRKIIVPTGEHRKMRDSRSHARSTPVYKAP